MRGFFVISPALFEGVTGADAALGSGETPGAPVPRPRRDEALRLTRRRNLLRPHFPSPAITLNEAIAQCGDLEYGACPNCLYPRKLPQNDAGYVKGAMGGLELSKLTVFWNFIDSLKRQNPVRRVRKPRLGRVVPQRPLWVRSRRKAAPISMSAFGGKADVIQGVAECPLLATSGHSAPHLARSAHSHKAT